MARVLPLSKAGGDAPAVSCSKFPSWGALPHLAAAKRLPMLGWEPGDEKVGGKLNALSTPAENGGADTDDRRAFGNRFGKVGTHPHRKFGKGDMQLLFQPVTHCT